MIQPARGCVIVKPVSTEEQRAGSPIILLEDTRERLANHQMLVVSVGPEEICDDFDCEREHWQLRNRDTGVTLGPRVHPTDQRIKPDAWILVRPRSLVEISSTDKLYSCKISDIVGVFTENALTDSAA